MPLLRDCRRSFAVAFQQRGRRDEQLHRRALDVLRREHDIGVHAAQRRMLDGVDRVVPEVDVPLVEEQRVLVGDVIDAQLLQRQRRDGQGGDRRARARPDQPSHQCVSLVG